MPRHAAWIALASTALLTGCLVTHDDRVRVRRDPGMLTHAAQGGVVTEPVWPPEELSPELEASVRGMRTYELLIRAKLAEVSPDPLAAYEDERADVLVRPWADAPWRRPPLPEAPAADEASEEVGEDEAPSSSDEDEWGDQGDEGDEGDEGGEESDGWGDEDAWGR